MPLQKKMKFSIKDFFSKCDQIRRKIRIWSHLLKNSLMENFSFLCSVSICFETKPMTTLSSHFNRAQTIDGWWREKLMVSISILSLFGKLLLTHSFISLTFSLFITPN